MINSSGQAVPESVQTRKIGWQQMDRGEIIGLLHAREKIKYLRQSKAGSP